MHVTGAITSTGIKKGFQGRMQDFCKGGSFSLVFSPLIAPRGRSGARSPNSWTVPPMRNVQ